MVATVRGKQLNRHHCNSQNDPHEQGELVHGNARSRAGDSGGGGDSGGNGDIPASNIHIQDVSVITLKIKINKFIPLCCIYTRHRYKGGLI